MGRGQATKLGRKVGRNKETCARYKLEHRLLVVRKMGRPLKRKEIVHHLNGIKDDNRLENLFLLSGKEHRQVIPILQKRIRELEIRITNEKN